MNPDFEFVLPWPITVNHYHQPIRTGTGARIIKSARAREYEALAIQAMVDARIYNARLHCPVELHITLHPPTLKDFDLDNRLKAILDALTGSHFWLDDAQVYKMTVIKGEKTEGGKALIKAWRLGCH